MAKKGNFEKIINGPKPVLIDFHALWCGPCKSQGPVIHDLIKDVKEKIRIIKIDIDKNQNIAKRYDVMSVPTLMIFKNGEKVWERSGFHTKAKLIKAIDSIL